ncbi:hypothetical protein ACFL1U_03195, partial [Patescibacteria group bacterium]
MRKFKNILVVAVLGVLAFGFLVAPVAVGDFGVTPSIAEAQLQVGVNDPGLAQGTDISVIIQRVLNWVLGIAGAFAVLFLVIGGFRYVVSAGNDAAIESAKSIIKSSIIGLVIIII